MKSTEKKWNISSLRPGSSGGRLPRALPHPLPETASGIPTEPRIFEQGGATPGVGESTVGVQREAENG